MNKNSEDQKENTNENGKVEKSSKNYENDFDNYDNINDFNKGNLIKISSLFEESMVNVTNLLNDISNYNIFDKNVVNSEIDNSNSNSNSNSKSNNKEFKGFLYNLSLKENYYKCTFRNFYKNSKGKN